MRTKQIEQSEALLDSKPAKCHQIQNLVNQSQDKITTIHSLSIPQMFIHTIKGKQTTKYTL